MAHCHQLSTQLHLYDLETQSRVSLLNFCSYVQVCVIVCHCLCSYVQVCVIVCHCLCSYVQVCVIICHCLCSYVQVCVIVCHYLCTGVCHCMSLSVFLCTGVCHCMSLSVFLCTGVCHCMSLCVFLCTGVCQSVLLYFHSMPLHALHVSSPAVYSSMCHYAVLCMLLSNSLVWLYCSHDLSQWVPLSDVVVAQNKSNLCVWYNIDTPDRVTIHTIKVCHSLCH